MDVKPRTRSVWDWRATMRRFGSRSDGRPLSENNPEAAMARNRLQAIIDGGTIDKWERSFIQQPKMRGGEADR